MRNIMKGLVLAIIICGLLTTFCACDENNISITRDTYSPALVLSGDVEELSKVRLIDDNSNDLRLDAVELSDLVSKAKIVGETTYGKGSMQSIRSFSDGTGFKFTYRYYCPPFSDNYDGVGVVPDMEVKLSEESAAKNLYLLSHSEDAQLAAAVDTMK